MGPQIRIVAKLEPVDRETKEQIRKLARTKLPPDICSWLESQVKASTNPVLAIKTPIIEANIQAVIMIMTMDCDMPSMTTWLKTVLSLDRIKPIAMASHKIGQKPFSSGAPDKAIEITPPTKTTKGKIAPSKPPWKDKTVSVFASVSFIIFRSCLRMSAESKWRRFLAQLRLFLNCIASLRSEKQTKSGSKKAS